jgi:CrcB protein
MEKIIYVGLGGAAGTICRYLVLQIPFKADFPLATLLINITGSILMGILAGLLVGNKEIDANLRLLLQTGFCGGYTTLSAFSLETVTMIENGKVIVAGGYIVGTVMGAIVGMWLGVKITNIFI